VFVVEASEASKMLRVPWPSTQILWYRPLVELSSSPCGDAGGGRRCHAHSRRSRATSLTIVEGVEKQPGLKLTMRPMQVIVIDHLERKPTEN
jgi:uncharacterized protein (TIGR03435 family)